MNNFYRVFEEKHRGSRDLIAYRLRAYFPFIKPIVEFYPGTQIIDLGCGRGEWLELMGQVGFEPLGIDLDDGMLNACLAYNLHVIKGDAVSFLRTFPGESQAVVSAFHLIEHLSFEELQNVIIESLRVLKPGGLLIMETPNPENFIVATQNFYVDPTHKRPIPPLLLSFLADYYGYARSKVVRLQESKELDPDASITLRSVLEGVSPDYSVVAQKSGPVNILQALDEPFGREYGISPGVLTDRFDDRVREIESKAQAAHIKAQEVENSLDAIYSSYLWRMTLYARWMNRQMRLLNQHGLSTRLKALVKRLRKPSARRPVSVHATGTKMVPWEASLARFGPTPPVIFPRPKGERRLYYYVDHTVLCQVNTGMQRVARRLGRALLEAGELVYFVKWDEQGRQLVLLDQNDLQALSRWYGPVFEADCLRTYPAGDGGVIPVEPHRQEEGHWLIIPEVTHITFQKQPMTLDVVIRAKQLGLKSAFVFFDAIPLRREDLKNMAPDHETYMQQLLLADLIAPISNWSGRDLVSFFTIHEKADLGSMPRVIPIQLPGETQIAPRATTPSVRDGYHKVILSVGTISPHKNQITLVRAFEKYCNQFSVTDWELVLVGNLHPDVEGELTSAMRRNPRIKHLHNISDDELVELYRMCAFTAFPSVEEGFGLPILESLWFAKPCICANFGSMGEVAAGGGCLTINTHDEAELLSSIVRLTTDVGLLNQLSEEAVRRHMINWDDYARTFMTHLNETAEPLNRLGLIYYWVDHTATYPANSGIQRVTRGLARALIEIGLKLVAVKWDETGRKFYPPTREELEHLARWNGPEPSSWHPWIGLPVTAITDWLLIPELTTYMTRSSLSDVKRYARSHSLRTACVFFDAIPWKMRDIYPSEASCAHEDYMEQLNEFELVFPISQFSRFDLISFLAATPFKTSDLENRIQACVLPGEFLESPRITEINRGSDTGLTILCVGTVEPRKNHLALLRAFSRVVKEAKKPVELVIAGGRPFPELADEVQRYIDTTPGIRWEQSASDVKLRELYIACDFTVYPSLEEGFGPPILESLWYARPCVCRNIGAMAEVGEGGGCLMVDTSDPNALADVMLSMIENDALRLKLAGEAVTRPFKTWHEYAREVATRMAGERFIPAVQRLPKPIQGSDFYRQFVNIKRRPLLSICISTFNRAQWLTLNLRNLAQLLPGPHPEIEIVVCDNTSTDNTPKVVHPYLHRADFRYYRNPENVGMLGNLRVTAHHARGQYVWILGDDDMIAPGAIEKILAAISNNPDAALVYLNYAYTREDDASQIKEFEKLFSEATPITKPTPDLTAPISRLSTLSENFFTAIYCVVFRRDHALHAYSQDTSGRPFSTMLTCIPTTYHVLHSMMSEKGVWLGSPNAVVNMNVSWLKYASIWILERIPEAFDLAEKMGAPGDEIDKRRIAHLPSVWHWFKEIIKDDPEGNIAYFNPARLFSRFKHLPEFQARMGELIAVYREAHYADPKRFPISPKDLFFTINSDRNDFFTKESTGGHR